MPMLRNVIVELKRLIPIKLFKKKCFHDFLLDYSVEQRRILRNIYKQIEESHMVGSAIDEIVVVLRFCFSVLFLIFIYYLFGY